jgi:hypothetical protein
MWCELPARLKAWPSTFHVVRGAGQAEGLAFDVAGAAAFAPVDGQVRCG